VTPYEFARKEVGTVEWNNGSNPKVLAYYADAGHAWVKDDSVAWCAAFVGAMLKRAGVKGTSELTARSYLNWGVPVDLANAQPGDIVIFKRGNSSWQGHVGFFVNQSGDLIKVLGGNQSDSVRESNYSKAALLGVRRAPNPVAVPKPGAQAQQGFIPALLRWLFGGKA